MTNRQFVRKYYPDAVLEFHSMPQNTMRSRTWYEIKGHPYGYSDYQYIASGNTRTQAWTNAKKKIQWQQQNTK